MATFLLSRAFMGLFDSILELREAFHDLREGISMVFLTFTMAFLSNGCFLAETLLKSSILLVFTALTGIVGRMCAPMFLALRTAFLNSCLFRDLEFIGIRTLALTFPGGFLSTFLCSLIFGIGVCYTFFNVLKDTQ